MKRSVSDNDTTYTRMIRSGNDTTYTRMIHGNDTTYTRMIRGVSDGNDTTCTKMIRSVYADDTRRQRHRVGWRLQCVVCRV